MASATNWSEILDEHFPSYKVEVNAFLDTLHISSSTDVSIQKIYNAIHADPHVPEKLKKLYHECIFGTDKAVKLRIRNRIGNFKRGLRFVIFVFITI